MSKVSLIALIAFGSPNVTDQQNQFRQSDNEFRTKDLVVEIVVNCPARIFEELRYSIVSYSRVEKLYCTPSTNCFGSFTTAINRACT